MRCTQQVRSQQVASLALTVKSNIPLRTQSQLQSCLLLGDFDCTLGAVAYSRRPAVCCGRGRAFPAIQWPAARTGLRFLRTHVNHNNNHHDESMLLMVGISAPETWNVVSDKLIYSVRRAQHRTILCAGPRHSERWLASLHYSLQLDAHRRAAIRTSGRAILCWWLPQASGNLFYLVVGSIAQD